MKMVFIDTSGVRLGDGIEIDSRIPIPRIGEHVVLYGDYAKTVTDVQHVYPTECIFVYVKSETMRY